MNAVSRIELRYYVQEQYRSTEEWQQVSSVAQRLHEYLSSGDSLARIALANRPGQSSATIQQTFLEFLLSLGFESERVGLFSNIDFALRPDFYLRVASTGILLEVERGKTTINNMDLLDFWKCHLCPHANYLFLLVPTALRQNSSMRPRNEFASVERRLAPFFEAENYTNVRGLYLFGY